MAAYFSRTGGGVFAIPPTTINSDLIPAIDNFYNIGSAAYRWKSLSLGPGTLFITDTVLGTPAGITVTNGQLLTNNVGALVTGNLVLVDTATLDPTTITVNNGTLLLNNIQSIRTGNVNFIDSVLGTAATMNVVSKVLTFSNVNSVKAGNVIYSDGLTQSNAYIVPTANVPAQSPGFTSTTVDFASSNAFVHVHVKSPYQLNINLINHRPAKEVHVFAIFNGGGPKPWGYVTCSGVGNILTANTVDTNPYYVYQTLCSIRVASMDFTSQNSFAVIDNFYHT
jgi:hypothetical protein